MIKSITQIMMLSYRHLLWHKAERERVEKVEIKRKTFLPSEETFCLEITIKFLYYTTGIHLCT